MAYLAVVGDFDVPARDTDGSLRCLRLRVVSACFCGGLQVSELADQKSACTVLGKDCFPAVPKAARVPIGFRQVVCAISLELRVVLSLVEKLSSVTGAGVVTLS